MASPHHHRLPRLRECWYCKRFRASERFGSQGLGAARPSLHAPSPVRPSTRTFLTYADGSRRIYNAPWISAPLPR